MFRFNQRFVPILVAVLLVLSLYVSNITPAAFAAQGPKTFEFIEVTDFHGYLQNSAKLPDGTAITQQRAAVLAKQIKAIKAANPNTIILSGGDMFQGTPLSNVLKGQPVINFMNNIGFDAMALGNHEYDWGIETLLNVQTATVKNSSIPVLAANVYDKATNKPVKYVKPYVILEKGGVKIGVIGIVDNIEFPSIIMPTYIQNIIFKDPIPIVNTLAEQLRKKGAQIVVVLAHMGASSNQTTNIPSGNLVDFASKITGVDAILGGHSHTIVTTRIHENPVGIAGSYGQGYLDIKISIDTNGKVVSKDIAYNDITNLYNTANPIVDPEVQQIVNQANQAVGTEFNKVIGTAIKDLTRVQSAKPYGDSALGNWTAEVTRKAVNADFGFVNNGGLRIDIPKGDITVGTMFQFMPFDNTIVTLKMAPAQIKILLEQAVQDNGKGIQLSGLTFTYDPKKPTLQRIIDIKTTDGKQLDNNHLYLVATNNFMGTGGDGFLEFTDPTVAKTYTDSYKLARDVYIDAVKIEKQINAAIDGRIAPAATLAANDTIITILATSDIHGNIFPWDYATAKPTNLGLAKISTYVNQIRASNPNTLLVDNGDTIQGTPLSYYYDKIDTKAEYPLIKVMGSIKYDAWVLGNHEFNYGLDVLNRIVNDAKTEHIQILSANTYQNGHSNFVQPYCIKTIQTSKGEVKVGVLGLTTKEIPSWEDVSHYKGLQFSDLVTEANQWVPKLRAAGADIVIVAMHSGEETPADTIPENQVKAVATSVNGIDAIIAGHTHANINEHDYTNPAGQKVIVTEPGKWGQFISQIELNINKNADGKWVIIDKSSKTIAMNDSIAADPAIIKLAQPYQDATLAYVGTKIGVSMGDFLGDNQLLKETALMDLINKVQKHYAKTDLSIAAPLSNSARILKGDVTIQDLMSVYVYENYLYGIKISGKQLKDWMEWSVRYYAQVASTTDPIGKDKTLNIPDYNLDQLYGASYTIDLTQPAGSRIKNLKVNGKLIKDSDSFTVAINNYRFNGGGGFMKAAGITHPEVIFDSAKSYGDDGQARNLMINYIRDQKTIEPTINNDWQISTSPVMEKTKAMLLPSKDDTHNQIKPAA
jgi:2',3'-cyclic-nucleotide 2'-phosphodiesterase / 3'-nucleotidase / 5'-nucleotidase